MHTLLCNYRGEGFVPEICGSLETCQKRERKQTLNGALKFQTLILPNAEADKFFERQTAAHNPINSLKTMQAPHTTKGNRQSQTIELDPVLLTVHPILENHPQWADDDLEFEAFCRDVGKRGFDVSLKIDSRQRVVDGRQRLRAAKRLKLESVPCETVADDDVPRLILHYILQRRHYSKGALAYMAIPLIREEQNGRSLDILAAEFGFSRQLLSQALKVHEIFESGSDLAAGYKAEMEPKILAGDVGLGAVIAGFAGLEATLGKKKSVRTALDLWDRSFTDLTRRFSTWEKFDSETRAQVAAKLTPVVEAMPIDLLHKFTSKISAEIKRRKTEEGK